MILEDDFRVKASDITWLRGGYEQPGRVEKISLKFPSDIRLESVPERATISGLLAAGEIDAVRAR